MHRQALYEAVRCYLANQRQGTHDTQTRAEVAYSTAKLFRQKGTGRARAGSAGSPTRVGGGVAFGPHPRDYGYKLPRKIKRVALKSALSDRAGHERVNVVEDFALDKPQTRAMAGLLKAMSLPGRHTLLVLPAGRGHPLALGAEPQGRARPAVPRAQRLHRPLGRQPGVHARGPRGRRGGVRIVKDLSKVIVRPLITEQGADMREEHNQYQFRVVPEANKLEIKSAIEQYFGVKVVQVRTMNYRGKIKRMGRFSGKRADWKKAVVTLAEGETIDLFEIG